MGGLIEIRRGRWRQSNSYMPGHKAAIGWRQPMVWNPTMISNLIDWWRPDQGINILSNNVWTGINGKILAANNMMSRPGYMMGGGLNNQGYLFFDGSDDLINSGTDGLWANTDSITIVTVGNMEITRGRDGMGSGWSFIFPAYDDVQGRAYAVLTRAGQTMHISTQGYVPPNQSSFKLLTFDNQNTSGNSVITLYNNGTLLGTSNFNNGTFRNSTRGLEIGTHLGNTALSGQFSELVIYNKVVDGQDLTNLINYFKTKYNV